MRIILCSLFSFLFPFVGMAQRVNIENDFQRLDTVVSRRNLYIKDKEMKIKNYKKEIISATTPSDKYTYNKHLYDEYLKFNPDSAEVYALRCEKAALEGGMRNEYLLSKINGVLITILRGDYYKAQKQLNDLGSIDDLPVFIRQKLAMANLEFYMRRSTMYTDGNGDTTGKTPEEIWDEYKKYLPEGSWMIDYYETAVTRHNNRESLMQHLESIPQPSVIAAMLLYTIAVTYQCEGNNEMYCHYLVLSAINDISVANREAQSLVTLVNSNFVDLGSKRAFNYVMMCTENANYYKDWGRSYNILTAHTTITRDFSEKLERRSFYLLIIIILLGMAFALIGLLFSNVVKKRRRQAQLLLEIGEMNKTLHAMIEQGNMMQQKLKESNDSLKSEIAYRNSNFLDVYMLVSHYIEDMQTFRKSVLNLITVGKIDKARKELMCISSTEKYLQSFYTQFDKAFISSHPDFLEGFNALLRAECQITFRTPDELTPELRIYALVSIGITDSLSIAAFLHYSPQTIYNYRLRMRRCACIPEKNFAEAVAKLYL